jgi:hypothetical protein
VVENTAGGEGMIPEHGICFWIEIGSTNGKFWGIDEKCQFMNIDARNAGTKLNI